MTDVWRDICSRVPGYILETSLFIRVTEPKEEVGHNPWSTVSPLIQPDTETYGVSTPDYRVEGGMALRLLSTTVSPIDLIDLCFLTIITLTGSRTGHPEESTAGLDGIHFVCLKLNQKVNGIRKDRYTKEITVTLVTVDPCQMP